MPLRAFLGSGIRYEHIGDDNSLNVDDDDRRMRLQTLAEDILV